MNQKFLQRFHTRKRKKGDTAKLAAQLAPLEERERLASDQQGRSVPGSSNGGANHDYGAIVVDSDNLNLSRDIMEGRDGQRFLGMEPVVFVILGVMLAFIAFIAWQISLMPAE